MYRYRYRCEYTKGVCVRISEQYDLQDQTDYISAGKFVRFTIHASVDFPSTQSCIGGLYTPTPQAEATARLRA
jgi:hypothetical protein